MSTIERIEEFCPETEKFAAYIQRVEFFFAANEIPTDKKVPVLLSAIGEETYGLLRDLVAPANPKNKSFGEIVDALQTHYEPKRLIIAECFNFHRRDQLPGESVATYIAELRRQATKCSFGAHLEEGLSDRSVCGLRNESTQQRLLTQPDLDLATARQHRAWKLLTVMP